MVVTEDPCGDAGRGRGLHQIVAIGAEGGRQFIEPVAGMTSGGVRHVMRDDERRPVCRSSSRNFLSLIEPRLDERFKHTASRAMGLLIVVELRRFHTGCKRHSGRCGHGEI
jgi:hypothetical protein